MSARRPCLYFRHSLFPGGKAGSPSGTALAPGFATRIKRRRDSGAPAKTAFTPPPGIQISFFRLPLAKTFSLPYPPDTSTLLTHPTLLSPRRDMCPRPVSSPLECTVVSSTTRDGLRSFIHKSCISRPLWGNLASHIFGIECPFASYYVRVCPFSLSDPPSAFSVVPLPSPPGSFFFLSSGLRGA